jgi:hypothetical protein
LYTINPYCVIKIGSSTCKTRTCDGGSYRPVWKDSLDYKLDGDSEMNFKVFSSDDYAGDELLSDTVILLDDMMKMDTREGTFDLVKEGK